MSIKNYKSAAVAAAIGAVLATSAAAMEVQTSDLWPAAAAALSELSTPPAGKTWEIKRSPVEGLLTATLDMDVLYITPDGEYIMQGNLFHLASRTNLTDQAQSRARSEIIETLDRSSFVTFAAPDQKHEVIVFTDPDCGFCQRMHQRMDEYNELGITIHYMAFPRAGVGSRTYQKLVSVWCADDQNAAMDVAKAGQAPEPTTCANPVAEHYGLGGALGVRGTPAIIFMDGRIAPGYVEPPALLSMLSQ